MENNNTELIAGLRALADFLDEHPEVVRIDLPVRLLDYRYDRDDFLKAIRSIGGFGKEMDDSHFKAVKIFGPVQLVIFTSRENFCKKIVTWDCPDEPILKEFGVEVLP